MQAPKRKRKLNICQHLQLLVIALEYQTEPQHSLLVLFCKILGLCPAKIHLKLSTETKLGELGKRKRSSFLKDKESTIIRGIYFDGRKDLTLTEEKRGTKYYRRKVLEEHIALVLEPGSQ